MADTDTIIYTVDAISICEELAMLHFKTRINKMGNFEEVYMKKKY